MDTRHKIVTPAEAESIARRLHSQGTPVKPVTGYFDPIVADHARRLQEIALEGRPLMVFLDTNTDGDPLLSGRARAELLASLRVVDYVIPADAGGINEWLERTPARPAAREEAADQARKERLMRHVRDRQAAAARD